MAGADRAKDPASPPLERDRDAHAAVLADIRDGDFARSEAGRALSALAQRLAAQGRASEAEVMAYLELKTELVLRAEEILLSADDKPDAEGRGGPQRPTGEDRDKLARLTALERRLGGPVIAAVDGRIGFSRNDLWELDRFRKAAAAG